MQTYSTTGLTTRYGPQVAVHIPDSQWTFLRNQEINYNHPICFVHHLLAAHPPPPRMKRFTDLADDPPHRYAFYGVHTAV